MFPLLVALAIGIIMVNPFRFDRIQQATAILIVILVAFFIGYSLQKDQHPPREPDSPPSVIPPDPSVEPPKQPTSKQEPKDTTEARPPSVSITQTSEGPDSPNTAIVGDNNQVIVGKKQRHLTDLEKDSLVAELSPYKGSEISIRSPNGYDEPAVFAADFVEVFKRAEWKVSTALGLSFFSSALPPRGVFIVSLDPDNPPEIANIVSSALDKINLAHGTRRNTTTRPGTIGLVVGLPPETTPAAQK